MSKLTTNLVMQQLILQWQKCGIKQGDTVLLHSDIKNLLMRYNYYMQPKSSKKEKILSVNHILDSFLSAVGETGTLIIPLFNFDFTNGIAFDIRNTPSQMGVLTEVARKRDSYVRTTNPVYSFAIFGKNKQYFESIKLTTALGKDSVFSRLMELNGKIAILGLSDQRCMTFYHHIEEMHQVPYRITKRFKTPYTDYNGNTKQQTITLYVRDLDRGVCTLLNPVANLMWQEGLYKGEKYNEGTGFRTIFARRMYDFVSKIIKNNKTKGFLYEINKQ